MRVDSYLSDELHEVGICELDGNVPIVELASRLGKPGPSFVGGDVVDFLQIGGSPHHPNWMSSVYRGAFLPFHTDCPYFNPPPRFAILRCNDVGDDSVVTRFIDMQLALNELSDSFTELLVREPWFAYRSPSVRSLMHVATRLTNDQFMIRWDPHSMRPMLPISAKAQTVIDTICADSVFRDVTWSRGKTLVWDNWRFLHGRTKVGKGDLDPQAKNKRTLSRVLVY